MTSALADRPISILFAFDANYAQHAAACMASIIRHSRAPLDIVVAHVRDPSAYEDRIRRSFAGIDRVSITFGPVVLPKGTDLPTPNSLTVETYLRFWSGELLPGRSRAIYIDPDTIVTAPIEELWNTDLRGNVLGAVPIPNSTRVREHGMPEGSLFFNAGLLLMDLDAWRARDCRDRCLDYVRRHPERALDGDQDILNLVFAKEWLPLPFEWNVINPFFRPSYDLGLSEAERLRICAEARIIHFNGKNKPWKYLDNHPRRAEYWEALRATDWRDFTPADRTLRNVILKFVSDAQPTWLRRARAGLSGRLSAPAR